MVEVGQQLRNPGRLRIVGQHTQVLDLDPDGEVGLVGRVLPPKATNTSAKVADFVAIGLTCSSRYLVLQHCRSRSHFTRPLAWVWPVILRNWPKFSVNSLRSFPVNSVKFTTILEVDIALASWDLLGLPPLLLLLAARVLGVLRVIVC